MAITDNRSYIRWDATGVEEVPSDEMSDIEAVKAMVSGLQQHMHGKNGYAFNSTHAKTQGIVKGKLVVPEYLAPQLKQTELFSKGGEYPVVCRYSSANPEPSTPDSNPQIRGFAMKVFNVEGDMFEAGKDFSTHDFEFNDMPVLAPATAKVTKELFEILLTHGQDIPKLVKALSARPDAELQLAEAQLPIQHLVCRRQYSQTAYRYGNFVAKFCLVPDTETQRKLREQTAEPEEGTDFLHRWLQDFYEANDAQYLFQVQLCEDLEDQPVEYAGKEWDATKYPWQTVAKLVIPKQDSFSPDRIKFWQDHMRVDPWLGLKSLQPLGSSNRLRRIVYPAASSLRRQLNGVKEIHVKSADEVPS